MRTLKGKETGPWFVNKRTGELPERASGLCSGELAAFWNRKWWGFSLNKSMRKNGLGIFFLKMCSFPGVPSSEAYGSINQGSGNNDFPCDFSDF